jgi:hypothetical protein
LYKTRKPWTRLSSLRQEPKCQILNKVWGLRFSSPKWMKAGNEDCVLDATGRPSSKKGFPGPASRTQSSFPAFIHLGLENLKPHTLFNIWHFGSCLRLLSLVQGFLVLYKVASLVPGCQSYPRLPSLIQGCLALSKVASSCTLSSGQRMSSLVEGCY